MPTADPSTSEWTVRSVFIRPGGRARPRAFDRVFGDGEFSKRSTTAGGGKHKGISATIMTVAEAAQLKVAGVDVDDTKIPRHLVGEYWREVDRLERETNPYAAPLDQTGADDDGRSLAMEFKISALEDEIRKAYERRFADYERRLADKDAEILMLRRSLHALIALPPTDGD